MIVWFKEERRDLYTTLAEMFRQHATYLKSPTGDDQAQKAFAELLKIGTVENIKTFVKELSKSDPKYVGHAHSCQWIDQLKEAGTFDAELAAGYKKAMKTDHRAFLRIFEEVKDLTIFANQEWNFERQQGFFNTMCPDIVADLLLRGFVF